MLRLMMRRLHRQEEGFTLIELLVVIAIIALLAAFAAPKLFNAIQGAKDVNGKADLQTVTSALDRYNFTNSAYPNGTSAAVSTALVNGYLKNNFAWKNAYGNPYAYVTDGSSYYVLADMGNLPASTYTMTCGSGNTATFTLVKGNGPLMPTTTNGSLDMTAGCTWKDGSNVDVTNKVNILTN